MKLPINLFKSGMCKDRAMIGSWIMTGSSNVAEAMASSNLDFIIVDMEHTDSSVSDVVGILRAIEGTGTEAIVRPHSLDTVLIRRLLDCGARTLMVPFVETAEQAEEIVSATRYAPRGVRGFALMHRGSRYNHVSDYVAQAGDELCVIAQIETQTGIDNTAAIAGVDGIDALFYGPGDLSCVIGQVGQTSGKDVRALISNEVQRCRELGIATGTLLPDEAGSAWAKEVGFDFVSVGNDFSMITGGSKRILSALGS